ncbi:hypothetical protein O9992_21780 [Vibrio lentus]|nr:hypothetical protein [Vibrio lentus]
MARLLGEVVNIDKGDLSFMASEYDYKAISLLPRRGVWSETNPEIKWKERTAHWSRCKI